LLLKVVFLVVPSAPPIVADTPQATRNEWPRSSSG
jgi:hypothetical protein